MSSQSKKIKRLLSEPTDYTYNEAKSLLNSLGYEENCKGTTSGSRVCFFRKTDNMAILLHKPHPSNVIKKYAIKQLIMNLKEKGDI